MTSVSQDIFDKCVVGWPWPDRVMAREGHYTSAHGWPERVQSGPVGYAQTTHPQPAPHTTPTKKPPPLPGAALADQLNAGRSVPQREVLFFHIHQVRGTGQHGFHVGTGARQDALVIEARSLQLGLVEGFVTTAGRQFLGSYAGHVGPEVGQADITGIHQV